MSDLTPERLAEALCQHAQRNGYDHGPYPTLASFPLDACPRHLAMAATLTATEQRLAAAEAALRRLASPDEMNGMGNVDDMELGPGRGELEARMRLAASALPRAETPV